MDTSLTVWPAFIIGISFFELWRAHRRGKYNRDTKAVVLQVAVPRDSEHGPIVAEHLLSALHAVGVSHSHWDRLSGRPRPRLGLEIANISGTTQFLVWTPRRLRTVVESQVHARYPEAEIEDVADYSAEPPKGEGGDSHVTMTAEMTLGEPDFYPIKRHGQFEDRATRTVTDPLAGVTTALGGLGEGEQAWIQLAVRPAPAGWRRRSLKCLKVTQRAPFDRSPFLRGLCLRVYLARGFWTRLLLIPVRLLLRLMRGRGPEPALRTTGGRDMDETVTSSGDREDASSAAVNKINRLAFETSLRLVCVVRKGNARRAVAVMAHADHGASGPFVPRSRRDLRNGVRLISGENSKRSAG